MKTKLMVLSLLGALVVLSASLVQAPKPARAEQGPEPFGDTVARGLDYLVKQQHKDGHWEDEGGKHSVELTALAALALRMKLRNRLEQELEGAMCRGMDWLVSKCGDSGLIFSGHESDSSRYMDGHGLAILFLTSIFLDPVYAERARKLDGVYARAVKYTVKGKSTEGGWYRTSTTEGHDLAELLSTVIQVQALQAAENVHVSFSFVAIEDGQRYLAAALAKHKKEAKNAQRARDTAAALACWLPIDRDVVESKPDLREDWLKYCAAEIPRGGKMQLGQGDLTHFYYAQVLFQRGGKEWDDYLSATYKFLREQQRNDGSWPAGDGFVSSRICATAMWCIVLQMDSRLYPTAPRKLEPRL